MVENPNNSSNTDDSSSSFTGNIKRYAPPNQRNPSLGRRKSGGAGPDRVDRSSIYLNESEKNQILASRSIPVVDHRDTGSNNPVNESSHAKLISLHGCCGSQAFQLMNDRWEVAINEFNNPSIDLAERPIMYSGNGVSAWGHFRLPHQLVSPRGGPSSSSQMDFSNKLKRAIGMQIKASSRGNCTLPGMDVNS